MAITIQAVKRKDRFTVESSGWPDASNTGVPVGTTLTTYSGPLTITTPNTVIDSKIVTGDLTIETTGVIVKRCKINGDVRIDSEASGYSFHIEDCEIDAGDVDGNQAFDGTGLGARDFTALRVHIYGGKRGINCWMNSSVTDSYVHGQASDVTGVAHESGIRMGSGMTLTHNTILCDAPDFPPDAGCSADLTGYGDFAPVENNTIDGNLFKATTGGFCSYGGSTNGHTYSAQANNIRFTNNVWERGTTPGDHGQFSCGVYGPIADFDPNRPGNVWTNNKWDDGTVLLP